MTEEKHSNLKSLTILAIDHGEARIGLAIKPADSTIVFPLSIIEAGNQAQALNAIRNVIAERSVDVVVCGLPVNQDEAQAKIVKRFTRKLREGVAGVRWRFVDETLTTEAAKELERETGLQQTGRAIDDRAAALILETFLRNSADNLPA